MPHPQNFDRSTHFPYVLLWDYPITHNVHIYEKTSIKTLWKCSIQDNVMLVHEKQVKLTCNINKYKVKLSKYSDNWYSCCKRNQFCLKIKQNIFYWLFGSFTELNLISFTCTSFQIFPKEKIIQRKRKK
jgi:hypothetical protein